MEVSRNSQTLPLSFPYNYIPTCLHGLMKRIENIAKTFFTWVSSIFKKPPCPIIDVVKQTSTPEQLAEKRKSDLTQWTEVMSQDEDQLMYKHLDLTGKSIETHPQSGSPMVMEIGNYSNKSYKKGKIFFSVKLPRRQIKWFPEVLQKRLPAFAENQLDLQFVIYQKPLGQEFNLILHHLFIPKYPELEKVKREVGVGLYEGKGVAPASEKGVSFNITKINPLIVHTDGESYSYSPDNLRVNLTAPYATFYIRAEVHRECGKGIFGIIVDKDNFDDQEGQAVLQTLNSSHSLGEFVEVIGKLENNPLAAQISQIFSFNADY